MSKSYFKNVFSYLSYKYPNTKVFVISDEHFYHNNIINYTRDEFSSIEEMNEHIINQHNSVVGPDDIVIFLGDFCFKNGEIANMASRLNGHKFLICGNHDVDKYQKKYEQLGFENVFTHPIEFNDTILSHEPLMGEESKDLLTSLMKKEFSKNTSLTNIHGHEHIYEPHERSINVACENVDYLPMYIGTTSPIEYSIKSPLIIDNEAFTEALDYLTKEKHENKKILLDDFIYSMCLEGMQAYKDDTLFFGSYSLFKKYGALLNFSDLDGTVIYNPTISKKTNTEVLKGVSESAFLTLNIFPTCHPFYDKRMSGIYILGNLYSNSHYNSDTYVDMNMIYKPVYKPEDYDVLEGHSYFETQLRKYDSDVAEEYYFPHFEINVLNASGDLANLILQYLFQKQSADQRRNLLRKIRIVCSNIDFNNFDLDLFEDQIIRFLLRNIYFFDMVNRKEEIIMLLDHQNDINDLYQVIPKHLMDILIYIIYASDFRKAYIELKKSNHLINTCDEILEEQNKR